MIKKILHSVVLIISLGLGLYAVLSKNKVVVIRTNYVLEHYSGTDAASKKLTEYETLWANQVDSLQERIDMKAELLIADSLEMSPAAIRADKIEIVKMQRSLNDLVSNRSIKFKEIDEQLTMGIVNKMNDAVRHYAEANNYEIILGSETVGNVLFAHDNIDVTENFLTFFNKSFDE